MYLIPLIGLTTARIQEGWLTLADKGIHRSCAHMMLRYVNVQRVAQQTAVAAYAIHRIVLGTRHVGFRVLHRRVVQIISWPPGIHEWQVWCLAIAEPYCRALQVAVGRRCITTTHVYRAAELLYRYTLFHRYRIARCICYRHRSYAQRYKQVLARIPAI